MFADHFPTIFSNIRHIMNFDLKNQFLHIAYNLHSNVLNNSLFLIYELKRAIFSLNPKSAMGSDMINNLFLLHLPILVYMVLLDDINDS